MEQEMQGNTAEATQESSVEENQEKVSSVTKKGNNLRLVAMANAKCRGKRNVCG